MKFLYVKNVNKIHCISYDIGKLNFLAIYSFNLTELVEIQRVPSYGYPKINS